MDLQRETPCQYRRALRRSSFPVEKWKDAVYTNQKYFGELIEDQKTWVRDVAKHLKLSGRRVTLIEVTTAEPRR